MIIAQKKRKESIVEYVLYMWNVEDLIRANGLDMTRIETNVVSRYGIEDEATRSAVRDWWDNLTCMMQKEKLEQGGHLRIMTVLVNDMYNYHLYLLKQQGEAAYQNAFRNAWPDLEAWMKKAPGSEKMHHIETALTAVYEYYLLKLAGKTVLADTTNAIVRISHFLSILSQKYLAAEKELHGGEEG